MKVNARVSCRLSPNYAWSFIKPTHITVNARKSVLVIIICFNPSLNLVLHHEQIFPAKCGWHVKDFDFSTKRVMWSIENSLAVVIGFYSLMLFNTCLWQHCAGICCSFVDKIVNEKKSHTSEFRDIHFTGITRLRWEILGSLMVRRWKKKYRTWQQNVSV